ncbi:uncharacterized protein LOC109800361 [Cajanus cajan]|uniref:DUF4228 domain-containing protein n=1 Tax=Cajanus cajan TaxID=3821 RepID=A0A151TG80_CAJCA|nr:uncharacterized protein LOC109800361 [Cajanus cajan]KYP66038.1 hypothetical protein KK1_012318 [Cajanus cajan]
MGSCASTEYTSKSGNQSWQSTVNIVHLDGKLEQLKEPTKAWHVLSENPNCYMCCSESMYVGLPMPPVAPTQELQSDHIYFLVPLSKSRVPLSLQDLGNLAIKANAALATSRPNHPIFKANSHKKFRTHPTLSNVSLQCSH